MARITCNFQGRLGNCMFELAATLATAWRQGHEPVFPEKECDYYYGFPFFQQYIKPITNGFNWVNDAGTYAVYDDWTHGYREIPELKQDTMLKGFFTSTKYFNDYRKRIIDLYSCDAVRIQSLIRDVRNWKPGSQYIGVHVRRTDYVTDYGWDLPVEYYQKAAAMFPDAVFVIFSDDHKWCQEKLSFMQYQLPFQSLDYIELQLMGQFDGIIIANSTFSTWGAIMGDPDCNKPVVAPKQWLPPGKGNFNADIYEPHWILI